MRVSELANTVSGLADKVSELEETIGQRIRSEGEALSRKLEETIEQRITSASETMRRYFDETLDQRIKSEGETTRRHFDVVAEKIVGERNLGLDRTMATAQQLTALTAANAGDHVRFERRLDDHDQRLENIERGLDGKPV
jgi:predicted transcriptional regulator